MKISVKEKFDLVEDHGIVRELEINETSDMVEVTEVHERVDKTGRVKPGYCHTTQIPKTTMERFIRLYLEKMKGRRNEI